MRVSQAAAARRQAVSDTKLGRGASRCLFTTLNVPRAIRLHDPGVSMITGRQIGLDDMWACCSVRNELALAVRLNDAIFPRQSTYGHKRGLGPDSEPDSQIALSV